MGDSPQNIYAKNLQQLLGYPLRFPEPKPGLPESYEENGLQIGDVGYVDDEGLFEVLFNVCQSPDHELHRDWPNLNGLVGLTEFKPDKIPAIPNALASGRVIGHGVQGPHGDNLSHTQSGPCRFKSSSTSGAILVLPSGAIRRSLTVIRQEEFRTLAEKYGLDWCQLTRCKSLYLITGFYKTNSWYLSSFHGIKPLDQVILERDDAGRYTWHSQCDYRQSLRENHNENQAVLISGFKIQVRGWGEYVLVEKLTSGPRSLWSGLALWMGTLFGVSIYLWKRVMSSIFELWGRCNHQVVARSVHVERVPALFPPFHPSDIINRHLLAKNPGVRMAITHDSQWLSMLAKNEISYEDMVDEVCFQDFLEKEYKDVRKSKGGDTVYLRRKTDEQSNGEYIFTPHEFEPVLKTFSLSDAPNDVRRIVITRMRVENAVVCLRRMPVGFFLLFQFDGTKRRTKVKQSLPSDDTIEWDDEIMLPVDLAAKVQFSVNASFELEPILGNGESLFTLEVTMSDLSHLGCAYCRECDDGFACPSLLVSLEERSLDPSVNWAYSNDILECQESQDPSYIQVVEATNEGQQALLRYHNGQGTAELGCSAKYFKLALELCPLDHECYAAALCNHAMASFISCQVHDTASDFPIREAIALYRTALNLRPAHHPDRPGTLLHLSQALLYCYRRVECTATVADEIEGLVAEIKQTCSEDSYHRRAADLVAETLKIHQVLTSGQMYEFDELILELGRSVRMPPYWYFDRPYRLINFNAVLRKYFDATGGLYHLEKSISVIEEAMRLVPDNHSDKPWLLASLGDSLCMRSIQRSDIAELDSAVSMIQSAVELISDGHCDKPLMLASLGRALWVRFVQQGDSADLENAISMTNKALNLVPEGHFAAPWILACHSDALRTRATRESDDKDLSRSLSTMQLAFSLLPDGHFDKPWLYASRDDAQCVWDIVAMGNAVPWLNMAVADVPVYNPEYRAKIMHGHLKKPWVLASHGHILRACFEQNSDITYLEDWISMINSALKCIPENHFDKPLLFTSLGEALRVRFTQCGDVGDLENSVSMIETAVSLTRDGHFHKPQILAALGETLRIRFMHGGDVTDIERSISIIQAAVKLVPDSHLDKPWMLGYLGNAHRVRFVRYGDITNLEISISMINYAMGLPSAELIHIGMGWLNSCLGETLCARFVECSDVDDLENSISALQKAKLSLPYGHFARPWALASLGYAYRLRYEQRNDLDDFKTALDWSMQAVEATPDGHVDKPWILASRGGLELQARHTRPSDTSKLWIPAVEDAAKLAHSGYYLRKSRILAALGDMHRVQFVLRGDATDLENSISMLKDAVKLTPNGHSDKPWVLACLGNAFRVRFVEHGDMADLEDSISALREAVERVPDKHFDRPWMIASLKHMLRLRSERHSKGVADFHRSLSMAEEVMKVALDNPSRKYQMFTSHNETHSVRTPNQNIINHTKPPKTTLNVLFLGKTSNGGINLIDILDSSQPSYRKPHTLEYGGNTFRLYDLPTDGFKSLDELRGKIHNTLRTLQKRGGIHLFVYCLPNSLRPSSWIMSLHRAMPSYSIRIPTVAVVIGEEVDSIDRESWWSSIEYTLAREGLSFEGHTLVQSGSPHDEFPQIRRDLTLLIQSYALGLDSETH